MTPEVARREVAAAREAGWYVNHWGHKYVPPHPQSRANRLAAKPAPVEGVNFNPTRLLFLQAVAKGSRTLRAVERATRGHLTHAQAANAYRGLCRAAPWAMETEFVGQVAHFRLTDRGRALLEAWG
jgi:hypothetical protein